MPNANEIAAIWIADLNLQHLVDEVRRRTLGRVSRSEFADITDEMLERAVWARRHELGALAR